MKKYKYRILADINDEYRVQFKRVWWGRIALWFTIKRNHIHMEPQGYCIHQLVDATFGSIESARDAIKYHIEGNKRDGIIIEEIG